MSVSALTDYIAGRYSMTPDVKRHSRNQILVARAMDRRSCRKIQTVIPPERTPEATRVFYAPLSWAIEEVGTSGSDEDFV